MASFPAAMPPFWVACGNRPPPCGGYCPTFCKVQKVEQKTFPPTAVSLLGRHTPCAFSPPCLPPHGRLAHVRSQFSLFRRSPTHKNLPPATFCTSEQHFSVAAATDFSRQINASPKNRPQGRIPSVKPPQTPSISSFRSPS